MRVLQGGSCSDSNTQRVFLQHNADVTPVAMFGSQLVRVEQIEIHVSRGHGGCDATCCNTCPNGRDGASPKAHSTNAVCGSYLSCPRLHLGGM